MGNGLPRIARYIVAFWALWAVACGSSACAQQGSPETTEGVVRVAPPEAAPAEAGGKSRIEGPFTLRSEIFPGTTREYWIYVPAQYDPADRPACTIVVQDGLQRAQEWELPAVMDQLIAAGEMPVTIGIFVNPGITPSPLPNTQPRFNRSFEYDSLGDRYARFVLEELLPPIEAQYNLSKDPNDRAIAGASSGAICAFNAAWERPDAFRRVLSTIGTYVGLRGADTMATMVRKCEGKPLRIFLEDGSNDLNIYAGDWWMANQTMLRALQWAGYEVEYRWGDGGHNGQHAKSIMLDAMRWLWDGWPEPIRVGRPADQRVNVLLPDVGWQVWSDGLARAEGLTADANGVCFVCDPPTQSIYRLMESDHEGTDPLPPNPPSSSQDSPPGAESPAAATAEPTSRASRQVFLTDTGGARHIALAADGRFFYVDPLRRELRGVDLQGTRFTVESNVDFRGLVCMAEGLYALETRERQLWQIAFDGRRQPFPLEVAEPSAITVSADHSQLHIADFAGRFYAACQRAEDGSPFAEQPYGWFHQSDAQTGSGCTAMVSDEQGHTYAATPLGVQIFDALGRVNLILSPPAPGPILGMTWTGSNRDQLTISVGNIVYRRKLNTRGTFTPGAPTELPRPRL